MSKTIRIGTRDSKLALWQATTVQQQLETLGYKTQLVPVKSQGDIILDKPLYQLGITGVFTKTLDVAMLNGDVDIAVHSMKDVPTLLPKGIIQTAVLPRANTKDILVYKDLDFLKTNGTIATGSLRRKAQWLNKYPNHKVEGLRGNVITRLQKLENSTYNAAIFAKAGLERIEILPENHIEIDWMVPAPAQGAMVVVTLENDSFATEAVSKLNHKPSEICTHIEREFLNVLEGGCTAPIGALATIKNNTIVFKGVLLAIDGSEKLSVEKTVDIANYKGFGKTCALEILNNGGKALMTAIKAAL
ncbi:porphobilinogen deaminase [Mangrovimonas yunxiaonensis]|uniref:Hydroxymethylbilane synthase n=1 Tax=Mangrovimonas yunxiaonensis TaxID=1197477 RepID=A0A084TKD3_9FLAO|nr:hydroxymethylbilane synthase [Mangrovimonas yunxiaonensis]KFB01169.1 porphobilinogen deaminase [Mangrovimonas yunxiaonensis]MBR9757964.1 hydroxymethylbilane synthase [Algicola sp.]GGH38264.1 hydroxymethylbilane synthase [Mangrovimonas yunxiaonensis]